MLNFHYNESNASLIYITKLITKDFWNWYLYSNSSKLRYFYLVADEGLLITVDGSS